MGAWGTALFSDDDACDIRDDYRTMIGDGLSGPEATDRLLAEWPDHPTNTVFWLALGATQWKCGRLEERVKNRALEIIANEADLQRWESSPDIEKRRIVLRKLQMQLQLPQPTPTKIRKRFRSECDWEVGELISYRLLSGRQVVFRVIGHHKDKGGTAPTFELLDWSGESLPTLGVLDRMGIRDFTEEMRDGSPRAKPIVTVGAARGREFPDSRLNRLQARLKPSQPIGYPSTFILWRFLDNFLKKAGFE